MPKFAKYQIPSITVEDASSLAKDVRSDPAFPSAENYDVCNMTYHCLNACLAGLRLMLMLLILSGQVCSQAEVEQGHQAL